MKNSFKNFDESNLSSVSIIIPMYNSSKKIGRCLESIKCLDYPSEKIEIIVVDDGSIDSSVKVAQEYGVTVLEETHGGPSSARNKGVELASYKIIAFLDADDIAQPQWIRTSVNVLQERNVAAVGCCYGLLNKSKSFSKIIWLDLYTRFKNSPEETNHLGSSGFVCKKNIFMKCGGFDEKMLAAEDMFLSYNIVRKKNKILLIKNELLLIEVPESPVDFFKKGIIKSAFVVVFNLKKYGLGGGFGNNYSSIVDLITSVFPMIAIIICVLSPPFKFMSILLLISLFFLMILFNMSFIKNVFVYAKKNDNLRLSWIIMLPLYLMLRSFSWCIGLIYSVLIITRARSK